MAVPSPTPCGYLRGATALGRDDLGHLAPGAKADLLIFAGDTLNMAPLRDPVKNIVYYAEMEDLDTVIIDGQIVVEHSKCWRRMSAR